MTRLPLAEEITELRHALLRARTAEEDLLILAAAGGHPGECDGVAARWPEASVEALVGHLTEQSNRAAGVQIRLTNLRKAQHEALHAPEWAAALEEAGRLAARREELNRTTRVDRLALDTLSGAQDAVTAWRADIAALAPGDPRAAHLPAALERAARQLLDAAGVEPRPVAEGLDPLDRWISSELEERQARLAPDLAELSSLDAELEHRFG